MKRREQDKEKRDREKEKEDAETKKASAIGEAPDYRAGRSKL